MVAAEGLDAARWGEQRAEAFMQAWNQRAIQGWEEYSIPGAFAG